MTLHIMLSQKKMSKVPIELRVTNYELRIEERKTCLRLPVRCTQTGALHR